MADDKVKKRKIKVDIAIAAMVNGFWKKRGGCYKLGREQGWNLEV